MKSTGESNFDKFEQFGASYLNDHRLGYDWQLSTYMYGTNRPAMYAVVPRVEDDAGLMSIDMTRMVVFTVDEAPVSKAQLRERAKAVRDGIRNGDAMCDRDQYPCPMWRHHDDQDKDVIVTLKQRQVMDEMWGLAAKRHKLRAEEVELEKRRKELDREIADRWERAGLPKTFDAGAVRVTVSQQTRSTPNVNQMKLDLGDEWDDEKHMKVSKPFYVVKTQEA